MEERKRTLSIECLKIEKLLRFVTSSEKRYLSAESVFFQESSLKFGNNIDLAVPPSPAWYSTLERDICVCVRMEEDEGISGKTSSFRSW